jgi:septal ring-binding cell division protein DamX
MMATHKVGGEVDALCTRCKMNLAHTILAMVGTKPVRVRCNTCGGDHAFRGPPGASERKASTSTAKRTAAPKEKVAKVVVSFDDTLAGKDVASSVPYSVRETFKLDQVINHPTFGQGFVSAVRGDKVDITFRSEVRTLIHGRGGGAPASRPSFSPPAARSHGPADKPVAAEGEAAPDATEPAAEPTES